MLSRFALFVRFSFACARDYCSDPFFPAPRVWELPVLWARGLLYGVSGGWRAYEEG